MSGAADAGKVRDVVVRPKRVPVRTCVACRTAGGKRGLMRIVRLPERAGIAFDPTGKRSGRGAYLCPTTDCLNLAIKRKALERSLKTTIPDDVAESLKAAVATLQAQSSPGGVLLT